MTSHPLTPAEIARFRSAIQQGPGCWEWTRERNNHGYGRFTIYRSNRRKRLLAHRLALTLKLGREPRGGTRHRCDNPPCCRPDHLLEGTQRQNIHDALSRERLNLSGLVIGWAVQAQQGRALAAARLKAGEKACRRCQQVRPLAAFHRHARTGDGRQTVCKACEAERRQLRRGRNGKAS
jgi:hypothetical protein